MTALQGSGLVIAAAFGLAIGSFLNVVVHRIPVGESVVNPPSRCPHCGAPIRARHNVPVVGWLVLRGRCFDCATRISLRYPLVEATTAALFLVLAVRFIDRPHLLPALLYIAAVGVALALIDLDVRRLPNVIVLPSYAVVAALLVIDWNPHAFVRAATGGAVLFAFFLSVRILARGAMGLGDVKLAGLLGAAMAYLSWGTLLTGAFLAFIIGAAVGIILIASGRAGRRTAIPFGPFMIVGALSAILGAGELGDAYLRALGL